jgi:N-acetylglutamate synthase-like GNAT family acetyltransferase
MSGLVFTGFDPAQNDIFRSRLEMSNLPTDDLAGPDRLFFRLSDDDGLIGYIGLEGSGPDRLLRSLVVMNGRRGQGYGRQLVERLEVLARHGDIERLHLLTTTAAPFFPVLDYAITDRASTPASIAASAEFTTLCPANATYMTKGLVDAAARLS